MFLCPHRLRKHECSSDNTQDMYQEREIKPCLHSDVLILLLVSLTVRLDYQTLALDDQAVIVMREVKIAVVSDRKRDCPNR